jgi:hypothetical protein
MEKQIATNGMSPNTIDPSEGFRIDPPYATQPFTFVVLFGETLACVLVLPILLDHW